MGGLAGRAAGAATGGDIAQVARVHATVAIDAVFAEALEIAARERRTLSAEELAAFRRAVEAIETDSAPAHVGSAKTDAELARTLGLTGSTSFGIGSTLAKARSEEHTSELQSLMRISYAVFCLKQTKNKTQQSNNNESSNATTNTKNI